MPQVNGDVPNAAHSSAFIEHLLKYPVIHDSVTTFQQNQLGQKSMQIGDSAYKTFAKPVMPLFSRPYQYVSPYLQKADNLGAQALDRVDERIPAVKKPTQELYADARGLVLWPINLGFEGKDHVLDVYSKECSKVGGESLVTYSKAAVITALIVSTETITWVGNILNTKKAEAKETANEKVNN